MLGVGELSLGRNIGRSDALSPTVIADLIRTEVEQLIDWTKWRSAKAKEDRGRRLLAGAAANWTKVEKLLGKR